MTTTSLAGLGLWLRERVGTRWVVATPIGVGKPNPALNAVYQYARRHADIELTVCTALSLNRPSPGKGLRQRLLGPFVERYYGEHVDLDFVADRARGALPENVHVVEFYLLSGSQLGNPRGQRDYLSSNYTHAARDLCARGVNILLQLYAEDRAAPERVSLSCNPDVTLELLRLLRASGRDPVVIGQAHEDLPYLHGDAEVPRAIFDLHIDERAHYPLFAVPAQPVSTVDHLIGLRASTLIPDGATLQVGIGALADALCHWLGVRQRDNAGYRAAVATAGGARGGVEAELAPFAQGCYASTELLMDGLLALLEAGVLRRGVIDDLDWQAVLDDAGGDAERFVELAWERGLLPETLGADEVAALVELQVLAAGTRIEPADAAPGEGDARGRGEVLVCASGERVSAHLDSADARAAFAAHAIAMDRVGVLVHAGFALGSRRFFERLRALPEAERRRIFMTGVDRVNQLAPGREALSRAQRQRARFVNTCMKMTLTGAAVSDTLSDGQVVSGVGGQYNFVAMGHALPGGRSVLMLRSTRGGDSNIVWEYAQQTIPRHLRDLVVTEYGIADLRGKTDEECVKALIAISDASVHERLRRVAVRHGKLAADWRVPMAWSGNRRARLDTLRRAHAQHFVEFPGECPFTATERALAGALADVDRLRRSPAGLLALARSTLQAAPEAQREALARLGLERPQGLRETLLARVIAGRL